MNKEIKTLLVDDYSFVRKGMKLLIQSKLDNIIFFEAENGIEALSILKKQQLDIVITDITMPEMDGIELTKKIKEIYPKTRVLVVSMHLDEVYIKDAIKAGAKGYLSKAMENENEIIQAIKSVMDGKTFYGKKTSEELIKGVFNDKKENLTPKEAEIAICLSNGLVYKEIANKMNISPRTVETYRKHILEKLNFQTTADIIKYAIKTGLVSLD